MILLCSMTSCSMTVGGVGPSQNSVGCVRLWLLSVIDYCSVCILTAVVVQPTARDTAKQTYLPSFAVGMPHWLFFYSCSSLLIEHMSKYVPDIFDVSCSLCVFDARACDGAMYGFDDCFHQCTLRAPELLYCVSHTW